MASLFEECIEKLSSGYRVLSEAETIEVFDWLQDSFPFTNYGRIDWNAIEGSGIAAVSKTVDKDEKVYVLWDNALYPAVEATFITIIDNIEFIKKVSFDTWIFKPGHFVVEFYHEGEVTVGFLQ